MAGSEQANNAGRRMAGFGPGGVVRGVCHPPGSKSILQRALVAAAAAEGVTRFGPFADDGDVGAARDFAARWARVERDGADTVVEGRPAGGDARRIVVDVGESGTLARLVTAFLALCAEPAGAHGISCRGTLERRRSDALVRALDEAGARTASTGAGTWPLEIGARARWEHLVLREPSSSQELTALLIAGAGLGGERELLVHGAVPSLPYVGLTAAVLERFGVRVATPARADGAGTYRLAGHLRAPAERFVVEPDASAAAVALAAACLTGGSLEVPGLGSDSSQGDVRIVEHLRAFGCTTRAASDRLTAAGRPTRPACIDLGGEPDLAPVLAAVAAAVALANPDSPPSRLDGLETLRGKESPRVGVLADGLAALGLAVEGSDTHLIVAPRARRSAAVGGHTIAIDSRGDHRMVFAFALLGLVREGVLVTGAEAVGKSWPSFWEELTALGARPIGA